LKIDEEIRLNYYSGPSTYIVAANQQPQHDLYELLKAAQRQDEHSIIE